VTELNFKGKEFVYNHHLAVPFRPLEPRAKKGIGPVALDANLIIHGDNLHALKALLPSYAGRVDCIFIDPPYNTGGEGWSYNDNVNSPMIKEWLSDNPIGIEDGLRHDKWCAMMWPRLRLLQELLSSSGSILVCCDDNEMHRLRCMMDEIFGAQYFLGSIIWKTRNTDNRVISKLSEDHEYVLVYSRGGALRGRVIDRSDFSNPDNDPRGDYVTDPLTGKATAAQRRNLHFVIKNFETGHKWKPDPARGWITDEAGIEALRKDNRIWWPPNPETGKPRKKRFLSETKERMPLSSFWADLKGQSGADEVDQILGERLFDFPKSVEFAQRIIDVATNTDSIVLDSFAGSGTTAHAVLAQNRKDGGSRKFILVEGEDYADAVTAERVRRVIKGYEFEGTHKEELLRTSLSYSVIRRADDLVHEVDGIENLEAHRFDRITKEVKDKDLVVTGEKSIRGRTEGLGGYFTYCTLGAPFELDRVLRGEALPSFESLGAALFHMATNRAFDPAAMIEPEGYLGRSEEHHVWLIYRDNLDWLKSPEAALTLERAKGFSAAKPDARHLVFAPSRFVSQRLLAEQNIPVEFVPLPFALYRIERA